MSEKLRYLALGDSYTIGESVSPAERWPRQLAELLRADGVNIAEPIIVAQSGWTTDELQAAIRRAQPQGPFDLVSLLIGVNNQYRGRAEGEYREQFIELLELSIGFAGGRPGRVLVLSIPDWGVMPYAEGRNRNEIARQIDRLNAINRAAAEGRGAQYVDVTPLSRLAARDLTLVAADGLHPSARMHAEWARLALPVVRSMLSADELPTRPG